jgi:hypothetical protein
MQSDVVLGLADYCVELGLEIRIGRFLSGAVGFFLKNMSSPVLNV